MASGNLTELILVAGQIDDVQAPDPAPDSWAADPANEVGIWLIKMAPHAQWTIPAASPELTRSLYFYRGSECIIGGLDVESYHSVDLLAEQPVMVESGNEEAFLLLLQGKPIDEPVVQHGPFVMNSVGEIKQAFLDYRETGFGGWPWDRYDNVHPRERGRFAKFSDGSEVIK